MEKVYKYIKSNYNFYILLGLTLAFHFVSSEAFLIGTIILSIFYILLDFLINRKNPIDKRYLIIVPLLVYLSIGLIVGVSHSEYSIHNIVRDSYYHVNTLVIIVLTLTMFTDRITKEQVFWCILIVGTLMGIYTLLKIKNFVDAGNPLSVYSIRYVLNNYGYLVNYLAIISFLFIKKYKIITVVLSIFNLSVAILSFSRILMILLILILSFLILYYLIFSSAKKYVAILLVLTFLILFGLSFTNIFKDYIIRFRNSIIELNPFQDWTNYDNVIKSWRGYEVWLVFNDFEASSILSRFFGNGFGSFIYTEYGLPYETNIIYEIPVFHNGYVGSIYKCGLVGLFVHITFLISLYYFSIKYIKNKKELFLNISLISYIFIATIVVMGIFYKDLWFILIFLIIYLIKTNYCVNTLEVND